MQGLAFPTTLAPEGRSTSPVHVPIEALTGAPLARMNNPLPQHSLLPPPSPPRRRTRLSFILAPVPLAKRPPGRWVIFIRPVRCTTHLCTGMPDGVLNMFREATNVMTLFLCIALRSPRKKQPRIAPVVECSVALPSFENLGLNMVMLLNGTPETVRLKQPPKGPLTPLKFRTSTPRLGRRRPRTPFASRLPLNVTMLVLGSPLSIVLIKVFMFVDGLSIWLGCTLRLRSMLVTALATLVGTQKMARMEFPRSLTHCPHLPLLPSPLWTSSRSLIAGVKSLRLDPV